MKKIFLSALGLLAVITACRDDDKLPVDFDKINNSNGAFVRIISTPSGSFDPNNVAGSEYRTVIEVSDAKKGDLLDNVKFFVTFEDNTPGNGEIETEVTIVKTVPAASFAKDATSGLPRATVTITANEVLTALGMSASDVLALDGFDFSMEVELTTGQVFNADNTSGDVLGGAFYGSPFAYKLLVVCPLDPDLFLGEYTLVAGASEFGDPVFPSNTVVELVEGGQAYQRVFEAVYLGDLGIGNAAQEWTINFICETTQFPKQITNLTCGAGSIYVGPIGAGAYDEADDTTFTVTLVEGPDGDDGGCGFSGSTQVTLTFTKVAN